MNDVVPMAIVDAGDDLLEEASSVRLLQLAVLDDIVEQFAARHVLHDHENVGRCADHLVQFDDVRVTEQLQVLNLAPDLADYVQVFDLLTVQNLDGHLVAGGLVPGGWTVGEERSRLVEILDSNEIFINPQLIKNFD